MGFQATFGGKRVANLDIGKYLPLLKVAGRYLFISLIAVGTIWFIISAFIGLTNQPQKVRVTNITGSAATISWITTKPDVGQVIISDDSKFPIWPFSQFSRDNKFYDDRDVAQAQEKSLAKWIKEASKDADATFSINSENAEDVYNYEVKKQGRYYVHHVTVFDLDESSKYGFKVGNGWRFWSYNSVKQDVTENDSPVASAFEFTTYNHPTSIPAPSPAYGKVFGMVKVDGQFLTEDESKDSVVFYRLIRDDGTKSNILSSVTNEQGGWTVDRSNWRDSDGSLVRFTPNADTAELWLNYQDVAPREKRVLLLGVDDEPADGLLGNYDDTAKSNENLIMKASRFVRVGFNGYVDDMEELFSSNLPIIAFLTTPVNANTLQDCEYKWFRDTYPEMCKDYKPDKPKPKDPEGEKECKCCTGPSTDIPGDTAFDKNCAAFCGGRKVDGNCEPPSPPSPPAPKPETDSCVKLGVLECYIGGVEPKCRCQRTDDRWVICTGKDQPNPGCQISCTPASCGSPGNAPGLGGTYGDNLLCPATKDKCLGDDACIRECFDSKPTKGMCCKNGNEYDWISATSDAADYCATYKGKDWVRDTSKASAGACTATPPGVGTCCHSNDRSKVKWDASSTYSCPTHLPQSSKTTEPKCIPVIPEGTMGTCCTSADEKDQTWAPVLTLKCQPGWKESKKTSAQCPEKSSDNKDYGGVCCKYPIPEGPDAGGFTKIWVKRNKESKDKPATQICSPGAVESGKTDITCPGIIKPVNVCPVGAICGPDGKWDQSSCKDTHILVEYSGGTPLPGYPPNERTGFNYKCEPKSPGDLCGNSGGIIAIDNKGNRTCLSPDTSVCCTNSYSMMSLKKCIDEKGSVIPGISDANSCLQKRPNNTDVCCTVGGNTYITSEDDCKKQESSTYLRDLDKCKISNTGYSCCRSGAGIFSKLEWQKNCSSDRIVSGINSENTCGVCCKFPVGNPSWQGLCDPLQENLTNSYPRKDLCENADVGGSKQVCCEVNGELKSTTSTNCNELKGKESNLTVKNCGYCCTALKGSEVKYATSSKSCIELGDGWSQARAYFYSNCPTNTNGSRMLDFVPTVAASTPTNIKTTNYVTTFLDGGTYRIITGTEDFSAFAQPNTPTFFYIERNDIPGFQAGDELIDMSSSDIRIDQINKSANLKIKRGINIISFPYAVSKEEGKPLMASEFLTITNVGSPIIQSITYFENGAWDGGLVAAEDNTKTPAGRDFPLQFGKGYLIVSNYDTTIEVPGFDILDPIPLAFKSGWNLVGVHGYNSPYTAHSFANSITALGTLTADNVTKWDTAKGRYEGIQVSQNTLYGFDYPIQADLGYFVRISEFKPKSPDSLSVIWAPGTDKHGTEAK
jgi:hypothetical protein